MPTFSTTPFPPRRRSSKAPPPRSGTLYSGLLLLLNLLLLIAAGASLLVRLQNSRSEQRQQIKVFVFGVAFVMFVFPLSIVVVGNGSVGVFLFPIIPVAAAIAILRYRLYDIDVVINRTLVYGALTATLAGVYLGSVLLLQLALDGSRDSDLAVAASTLAVAALFRPARTGSRRRSTALLPPPLRRCAHPRVLLGPPTRRGRPDALDTELRGVVSETMQPAYMSLWLRGQPADRA